MSLFAQISHPGTFTSPTSFKRTEFLRVYLGNTGLLRFSELGISSAFEFPIGTYLHAQRRGQSAPCPNALQGQPTVSAKITGTSPPGALTSAMLANLAVKALDVHLAQMAEDKGWLYTRYADDLAFSRIDDVARTSAIQLVKLVEMALTTFHLTPQRPKTSIASPGARKILLGVLVDRERPRLTRRFRDNLETHLYALTSTKLGAAAHMRNRGFASKIGMRRHVGGLLAFAHQVDPAYAAKEYQLFNSIDWNK
jgi:RNA-directed DNA polymerase